MDSSYMDGSGYDREAVSFYDVAHEGAQIRAISGVLDQCADLHGLSPRSLIIVATDALSLASARFVVRMRSPLRLAVVITDVLPGYVGALDVVVVVSDRAEDPAGFNALNIASRRGAFSVLAGPARGPLVDDAPTDTVVIPALPSALGASPARAVTVISTVLDLLEEDSDLVRQRLEAFAAIVDTELEQLSPERNSVVNPGRVLREFAEGARLVHTGPSKIGMAVAELVSVMWTLRGLPSGAIPMDELVMSEQRVDPEDIFHDPFLDGPVTLIPLKTIVWAESSDVTAAMPHTLAVDCETPDIGPVAGALRLITRGFAATTFDLPDAPVEDY
ncbi:hypothetical protein [Corynebacterium alimapuense]|uniref:Uncharacterized protein n=1 Tax=Corynebacterium alimapuense TaxID=1576874 RepID=A0A3M8K8F6_9CORY|nr:hypothetical protein [Corynebacterium alimapuense]RNE49045.1 hypothetical protein C5L39_05460 [Corynebacterium alimapuense]